MLARASLLIAALLLQPTAHAAEECFPPGVPPIPDGDTASETEMISARQRMKLFQEAAQTYMTCIDARIARGSQSERKLERWNKQREKVATSIQSTIDSYNAAVRTYKARAEDEPSAPETEPEPAAEPPKPSGESEPSSSGGIFIPE